MKVILAIVALATSSLCGKPPLEGSLDIPAIGRLADLGHFYDDRRERFIHIHAWPKTLIDNHNVSEFIDGGHTVSSSAILHTYEERDSFVDFTAGLQASLYAGLLDVYGSAKVVTNFVLKSDTINGMISVHHRTYLEYLKLEEEQLCNSFNPSMGIQFGATHVVTGIEWGANVYAGIYVQTNGRAGREHKEFDSKIAMTLEATANEFTGEASRTLGNFSIFSSSEVRSSLYSDVSLNKTQFDDYREMVSYLNNVPASIQATDRKKGSQIRYTIVDIKKLTDVSKQFCNSTTIKNDAKSEGTRNQTFDGILKRALAQNYNLDKRIRENYAQLMHLFGIHPAVFPTPIIASAEDMIAKYNDLQESFKNSVSEILLSSRSNYEKEHYSSLNLSLTSYQQSVNGGEVTLKNLKNCAAEARKSIGDYNALAAQGVNYIDGRNTTSISQLALIHSTSDLYVLYITNSSRTHAKWYPSMLTLVKVQGVRCAVRCEWDYPECNKLDYPRIDSYSKGILMAQDVGLGFSDDADENKKLQKALKVVNATIHGGYLGKLGR